MKKKKKATKPATYDLLDTTQHSVVPIKAQYITIRVSRDGASELLNVLHAADSVDHHAIINDIQRQMIAALLEVE